MSRHSTRALPFFAAAMIAAAPVFAHDHDGSKRLMRQMAMGEGDPQGLLSVPHSTTVRAEEEHIHEIATSQSQHESTHHDATKRHHKED